MKDLYKNIILAFIICFAILDKPNVDYKYTVVSACILLMFLNIEDAKNGRYRRVNLTMFVVGIIGLLVTTFLEGSAAGTFLNYVQIALDFSAAFLLYGLAGYLIYKSYNKKS